MEGCQSIRNMVATLIAKRERIEQPDLRPERLRSQGRMTNLGLLKISV